MILDHMGFRTYALETIRVAKDHDNIYLGTIDVSNPGYIRKAVTKPGADRIVYGSVPPWCSPLIMHTVIKLAGLTQKEEDLALGGNLARLLGVKLKKFVEDDIVRTMNPYTKMDKIG